MKRDATPHVEVRVTQRYSAPAERVFDAWIDPAVAGRWLFAIASRPAERVKINARVGGAFQFVERGRGSDVMHKGVYLELERPHRLAFTLSGRTDAGNRGPVRVAIVPLDKGCELNLIQEKVLPDQARRIEGRWSGMLYGLDVLLAGESTPIHE